MLLEIHFQEQARDSRLKPRLHEGTKYELQYICALEFIKFTWLNVQGENCLVVILLDARPGTRLSQLHSVSHPI